MTKSGGGTRSKKAWQMVLQEKASWRLTLWRHTSLLEAPTVRGRYMALSKVGMYKETKPLSISWAELTVGRDI